MQAICGNRALIVRDKREIKQKTVEPGHISNLKERGEKP